MDVIFLEGPSSAGKSTLAGELTARLSGGWIHWAADVVLGGYPFGKPDAPRGEAFAGLDRGYLHTIAAMADAGVPVVADQVFHNRRMYDDFRQVLGGRALLVRVTAPLEVLEERERNRGDRPVGNAASMAAVTVNGEYDLTVDTARLSSAEAAELIRRHVDGQAPGRDAARDVRQSRDLVLVSGAPGAGKSMLAVPLAAELGMPLIAKDVIKETLYDVMGQVRPDPWESSGAMGAAAVELMWRLGALAPRIVLESNFRHANPTERVRIGELSARPVEVYCRVSPEIAAARFAARNSSRDKHPVHVARSMPLGWFDQFQEPVGIGPVLEVDTTGPVDIAAVASWVTHALA